MNEFTFAGFKFPRYIPRFVEKKGSRSLDVSYYGSPQPNSKDQRGFYFDSDFAPGLRLEYANETNDETPFGIVYRLPHNRGFIAGWALGENMSAAVEPTVFADVDDAIRFADDCAESIRQDMRMQEYEFELAQIAD